MNPPRTLPLTRSIASIYLLPFAIAVLVAIAAIAGLANPAHFYPTIELRRALLPNDVVSLSLLLPFLLVSALLARRGSLPGLLCLPGALFYALYNSLIYLFALRVGSLRLLSFLIAALSCYAVAAFLAAIDRAAVQQLIASHVPARLSGAVLAVFGLLSAACDRSARARGARQPARPHRARRHSCRPHPYASLGCPRNPPLAPQTTRLRRRVLSLLSQAAMLFAGLIAFLFLQPLLFASAHPPRRSRRHRADEPGLLCAFCSLPSWRPALEP